MKLVLDGIDQYRCKLPQNKQNTDRGVLVKICINNNDTTTYNQ